MEHLLSIFNEYTPSKVMLVGDFMLDVYTLGKVKRISPEAPVSILNVENEQRLPGGAGNVILNAVSLGLEVIALGRVGNDAAGQFILNKLAEENVDIRGIFIDTNFQTPLKNRIIAENQQIVRVDYENPSSLSQELEKEIVLFLPHLLEGVKLIAISDYAKGFITVSLLSEIQKIAKKNQIPIIIDPKGKDFSKYRGSFLIKPNLSEAVLASGLSPDSPLEEIANKIISETEIENLLITRSKDGMSLFTKEGKRQDFPVVVREVKDVTGAGDTVLSMMMATVASGLDIEKGIQLANLAAGISIERLGCSRVQWGELLFRVLEIDAKNKIFKENHLFVLQEVLKTKSFAILALKGAQGLTTSIFKSIYSLNVKGRLLILYLLDEPEEEFVQLLASLQEVNFVILKTESLHHLCEQIHPKELYILEDKKLRPFDCAKEFLDYQINMR